MGLGYDIIATSSQDDMIELAISELQRISDTLNHSYDQTKIKVLTFLGAGLAILTYLYQGGDIFFPHQVYGMIFYCIGLGLTLAALTILFIALSPVTWYYPTELKDVQKFKFKNKTELLEYIKEEYINTITNNTVSYERKQTLLNISCTYSNRS